MKLKDLGKVVDGIAPLKLALDWDNVGLLIGSSEAEVKKVLLTIDVTKAVVSEAKKLGCDTILSYHPVIWDGLKRITAEGESSHIYDLVRSGINVFSFHTAYDMAAGGVNDELAAILGIADGAAVGDFVDSPEGIYYKVVTFVPVDSVNKVADAMFTAGAGSIGNYSNCSFRTEGVGTFLPLEGSNPAIGKKGKFEKVDEIKLESIVAAANVEGVVAALQDAHPYETVAYDVFRQYEVGGKFGLGRIGDLVKPTKLADLVANIKKVTGAKAVGMIGPERRTVRRAAVCAGSCGKIINTIMAGDCDLYLTGELKHHQALAAQEAGLTCICLSHTVSERFSLKKLAKVLKKSLKDVTIAVSKKDADPFHWVS
jgi:dinuclear metal center YbgI/SA1388 family protein